MEFKPLINMKAFLFILSMLVSISSKAQTWNEFVKQKSTQRKYLLQQIAALKIYAGYLSKGYKIANTGLKTIKVFTKGEFDLHSSFFKSLEVANPAIAKSKKIGEIISWQMAILKNYNSVKLEVIALVEDRSYFKSVQNHVFKECEQDIEELLLIMSSGTLEMNDVERITRIDKVHTSMREKYQFSQSFITGVRLLIAQRKQQEKNVQEIEKLHQINN